MFNIPRIIFKHNTDIGQKDHLWMDTNWYLERQTLAEATHLWI